MKKPHLLITRPKKDAGPLKKKLEARGYKISLEPVMHIAAIANIGQKIRSALRHPYQAIIVTSKNTLRVLHESKAGKNTPLLVVGTSTTKLAKQMGFLKAQKAGNSAEELAEYISSNLTPSARMIFYPMGENTAIDLVGILKQAGFNVKKLVVYRAPPFTQLSKTSIKKLTSKHIDGILLFSTRSAKIFLTLAAKDLPREALKHPLFFCLSRNIAAALPAYYKHCSSMKPSEASLIALVEKTLPLKDSALNRAVFGR